MHAGCCSCCSPVCDVLPVGRSQRQHWQKSVKHFCQLLLPLLVFTSLASFTLLKSLLLIPACARSLVHAAPPDDWKCLSLCVDPSFRASAKLHCCYSLSVSWWPLHFWYWSVSILLISARQMHTKETFVYMSRVHHMDITALATKLARPMNLVACTVAYACISAPSQAFDRFDFLGTKHNLRSAYSSSSTQNLALYGPHLNATGLSRPSLLNPVMPPDKLKPWDT